jgi:hypothetical protein
VSTRVDRRLQDGRHRSRDDQDCLALSAEVPGHTRHHLVTSPCVLTAKTVRFGYGPRLKRFNRALMFAVQVNCKLFPDRFSL